MTPSEVMLRVASAFIAYGLLLALHPVVIGVSALMH
jgi:hypothetical protein